MAFAYFIISLIILRLAELVYARRNAKWLLQHGAVEHGAEHYPFIVLLHVLFLSGLILEYCWQAPVPFNRVFFMLFLLCLVFKGWVLISLGKFWNTRIYRIPNFPLVKAGPYRFFKHPNYIIVVAEILIIPMIFNLYYSAVVFSVLNAIMLQIRIKAENRALASPLE